MAEQHLILLDSKALELTGKIIKHVDNVKTPEAAVKWALKECAARWPGTTTITFEWQHILEPVSTSPQPVSTSSPPAVTLPDHIPLWEHHLGVVKVPLTDLTKLSGSVIVGSETLQRLAPDETERASILTDATIGKIRM